MIYELKPFLLIILSGSSFVADKITSVGLVSSLLLCACALIILHARLKHRGLIN